MTLTLPSDEDMFSAEQPKHSQRWCNNLTSDQQVWWEHVIERAEANRSMPKSWVALQRNWRLNFPDTPEPADKTLRRNLMYCLHEDPERGDWLDEPSE